ncbi:MAG TPA: polysaccharide deacetylase family protein [Anaerolineae bacterium]|nr:polysaccharide deacetylase family protein [Anaerolineae bacterium]
MLIPLQRGLLVVAIILLVVSGVMVTHSAIAAPLVAPFAQSNPGSPSVCTWFDCKAGAISYSQDDAANINPTLPDTNSCQAALENAGLRGTFFYDGDNSTTPAWLSILSNAGHEVGSHLVSHQLNCTMPPPCFPDCTITALLQTSYTADDVANFRQNQIDPNVAAIESYTEKPVVSMAYPCGNTDMGRMTAAQDYYLGARSYYDPYDSNFTWVYDTNPSAPPYPMILNSDTYFSQPLVDKAIAENGWEIITVHDFCPGVDVLQSISNTTWVAPIGDVSKYIHVRNATQFSNYVRAGYFITFDVVSTAETFQRQQLDGTPLLPIIFDNPVTIRAPITLTAGVVGVQLNGSPVSYTVGVISGTNYVWFNTPLTLAQHVAIQLDTPTAVRVSMLQAVGSAPDVPPLPIIAGSTGVGLAALWVQRRRQRGY